MEIKYEAVFGDQSLFDGVLSDCEFASEMYGYMFANGILYYCEKYNEKAEWSLSCKNHLTFKPSAMRRIIAEPKRWTVEDQKAGRLPEVGDHLLTQGNLAEFIGLSHAPNNWCFRRLDGDWGIQTANMDWFSPIESPEEKAARLREEWCSNALGSASILSGMQEYELKRLGGCIGNIYDAKKLSWLLGLEKETLADMAHQQSKIIEKLQKAEKAQRLEDEWVNRAWGETAVFAGVTQDEDDRLRIHLKYIYRAQLSGELKMPESTE